MACLLNMKSIRLTRFSTEVDQSSSVCWQLVLSVQCSWPELIQKRFSLTIMSVQKRNNGWNNLTKVANGPFLAVTLRTTRLLDVRKVSFFRLHLYSKVTLGRSHVWIFYIELFIYTKMDLALNDPQLLICHNTKAKQTKLFKSTWV